MSLVNFQTYQECSWKEMIIAISGAPAIKIRGVKYAIESEDEPLHAGGDEPISIQKGNRKYTFSFKFLKGALDDFQAAALALGVLDITQVVFTITVSYLPLSTGILCTDTISGCTISKWEKGWEQGAKYMDIEVPGNALGITSVVGA